MKILSNKMTMLVSVIFIMSLIISSTTFVNAETTDATASNEKVKLQKLYMNVIPISYQKMQMTMRLMMIQLIFN